MSHMLNVKTVCEQCDYLYSSSALRRLLGWKLDPQPLDRR